jgi:hypothetical protein
MTGEQDRARERALAAIAEEARTREGWNMHLALVWWTARIFGAEEVGGEAVAEHARARLEARHWNQALVEPDLLLEAVAASRP